MTNLNLTATAQAKPGQSASPLNLTALLAAGTLGSNTGVTWSNTGREVLHVQQGASPSTIVVTIGSTVEGQPVTSITYSGVASAIQAIGPFNSDFAIGGVVTVTFGTAANVAGVALVANAGAS